MTLYVIFAGDAPAWVTSGYFPANRAYENIRTAKTQITNYTNAVKRQKKYGYKDFRGDYKVLPGRSSHRRVCAQGGSER